MGRGKKKKRRTQHDDGIEMDEGNQPNQGSGTNKDSVGNRRDVSGTCNNGADSTNEPNNGIEEDDYHEGLSSTPDDVIMHSHIHIILKMKTYRRGTIKKTDLVGTSVLMV